MNESDVVEIVDPGTNEVISHCYGPAPEGSCPMAALDGTVLCHGCRITGPGAGPEYSNLWVPPDSRQCPRAWNLESLGY
jgi:hypothetical protein